MTWINFAEIRARVSLEDVLFRLYSFPALKREGAKVVGPCPIHNGDGQRSFNAQLDRKLFHCFACGASGNQLDFVAQKEGITIREAALRVHRHFLANGSVPPVAPDSSSKDSGGAAASASLPAVPHESGGNTKVTSTREPAPEPRTNPVLELKLTLKGDHPHLKEERKLLPQTVKTFGVGYCSSGTLRGQIAIPIHDEDGNLVAYAGRRLKADDIKEHGKYRFPRGFVRDVVVYNYHRAAEAMAENGLIVAEGFFTVMKLHELGFPHTVATMGVEVSESQLELLARAPRVFVLFDGDEAGRRGGAHLASRLKDRTAVHLIEIPMGMEPEDLSAKALRWAVNGARELNLATLSFSTRT